MVKTFLDVPRITLFRCASISSTYLADKKVADMELDIVADMEAGKVNDRQGGRHGSRK